MRTPPRRAAALASLLLVTGIAAACVPGAVLPQDCDAASVQRQAALNGDHMDPQSVDVCKGQLVTLKIATQRAGEVHLHGYDVEAPEVPVQPGDTATFRFKATRAGQFIIEL